MRKEIINAISCGSIAAICAQFGMNPLADWQFWAILCFVVVIIFNSEID